MENTLISVMVGIRQACIWNDFTAKAFKKWGGHSLILVFTLLIWFYSITVRGWHPYLLMFALPVLSQPEWKLYESTVAVCIAMFPLRLVSEEGRWSVTVCRRNEYHYFLSWWLFLDAHFAPACMSTIWRCHYVLSSHSQTMCHENSEDLRFLAEGSRLITKCKAY